MVFSSDIFVFLFLPLTLLLHAVSPRGARNGVLLVASLFFYAWGEQFYVLMMLVSIAMNYGLGLAADRWPSGRAGRITIALAVALNLGFLVAFKYAHFLVDNLNALLRVWNVDPIALGPVHLPIGISFFTFQAMSYVIDVYWKNVEVQRNPFRLGLYIAFFPQLIAGPIVRYRDIAAQMANRFISRADFAEGARRFVVGLAKKMLVANLVAVPADALFALDPSDLTMATAWFGVVCYALQIYFDFSGYSDMAIGLGRLFGFRFLENFDYPYIARSMTEFWRRWHISLSTWFRDYLYIPLGGNRGSARRTYFNLVLVFLLCGLWHGASWTFVVWGLFHGLFLVAERWFRARGTRSAPRPVAHLYALLVALVSWVLFRAETFPQALGYLKAMAGAGGSTGLVEYSVGYFMNGELALALLAGVLGSMPLAPRLAAWWRRRAETATPVSFTAVASARTLWLAAMLLLCGFKLAAGTHNPFIYFRF